MCEWFRDGHDDVIKWRHFPRYRPFVRGIHRSPVNSPPPPKKKKKKRPVRRGFDVFFDQRLNKRMNKQLRRRWFKTPSRSLWCDCNEFIHTLSDLNAEWLRLLIEHLADPLFKYASNAFASVRSLIYRPRDCHAYLLYPTVSVYQSGWDGLYRFLGHVWSIFIRLFQYTLKRKYLHFEQTFVIIGTWSCEIYKFMCIQ